MNRFVAFAVVALMAATGCATGVEDPQLPPASPAPPPAVETLSGDLESDDSTPADTSDRTGVPEPTGNMQIDAPFTDG